MRAGLRRRTEEGCVGEGNKRGSKSDCAFCREDLSSLYFRFSVALLFAGYIASQYQHSTVGAVYSLISIPHNVP